MGFALAKPTPSAHPVDVGTRSEAAIIWALIHRGYEVLIPSGVNHRYDLVIDLNGEMVRAQCKTGRLRDGVIVFNTVSVRVNTKGWVRRGYYGEVELFLVYCPDTDSVYCIPAADCPRGNCSLRLDPTVNNQAAGIRWARDYELPE